jgi:hypothetical protein
MNEKTDFLTSIGVNIPLIVAGFAGALVFVKRSKETSVGNAIFTVISGSITSNYLTPIVLKGIPMLSEFNYGVAFIMGYMGFSGIEFVIDKFVKSKPAKDNE